MTRVVAHEQLTLGTSTPRIGVDGSRFPSRYLTIDGTPAMALGHSCGTCALVLRRQPGPPVGTLDAEQVRDRLTAGLTDLDRDVVGAYSARLPRGDYLVMLLDVRPELTVPGSAGDYFAHEGPRLWAGAEGGSVDPANATYYRLGRHGCDGGDTLFHFAVPIRSGDLDADRVAHFAAVAAGAGGEGGRSPTAVAFGLLDIAGPHFRDNRHWGLFHHLLDGHHKMAAAAARARAVRLLTFVSVDDSVASRASVARIPDLLRGGI